MRRAARGREVIGNREIRKVNEVSVCRYYPMH